MMMSDDDTAQDDSHSNRTRYRREDCRDEHSRRLRCTCFVPDVQVLSGCGLIAVAQNFYSPATFCETKAGCPPACGDISSSSEIHSRCATRRRARVRDTNAPTVRLLFWENVAKMVRVDFAPWLDHLLRARRGVGATCNRGGCSPVHAHSSR